MALSRYALRKYSLNVDAYVHSLDTDEEMGESESTGWYGLYTEAQGFHPTKEQIEEHDLSTEDVEWLASQKGAIAIEDSQGFVSVDWYDSEKECQDAWDRATDYVDSHYEDEGDEG